MYFTSSAAGYHLTFNQFPTMRRDGFRKIENPPAGGYEAILSGSLKYKTSFKMELYNEGTDDAPDSFPLPLPGHNAGSFSLAAAN